MSKKKPAKKLAKGCRVGGAFGAIAFTGTVTDLDLTQGRATVKTKDIIPGINHREFSIEAHALTVL